MLKETTHRPGRGSNPGFPIRSPTLLPLGQCAPLLCFDLLLYVHGKQLVSCRDSQLLNHTVPGQVSRRQLTSVYCTFFWPVTDNLLFLKALEWKIHERRTRGSIFELFDYKADMLPTELLRLVFGFQKCVGGRGRSTVPIQVQISC